MISQLFPRGKKKSAHFASKKSGFNKLTSSENKEGKNEDNESNKDPEDKAVTIPHKEITLSHKNITEGVICLAAVNEICNEYVMVNIPGSFKVKILAQDVSKSYSQLLKNSEQCRKLSEIFTIGQIVSCKLTKCSGKTILGTTDPQAINYHIDCRQVVPGTLLQMSVASVEDHGYIMYSGVPGLQAFLPSCEATETIRERKINSLGVGMVLFCRLLGKTDSGRENSYNVSCSSSKVSKCSGTDFRGGIYPGIKTKIVVKQVYSAGLYVQTTCNSLDTFIEKMHMQNVDYSVGQVVEACILYKLTTASFFCASLVVDPGRIEPFTVPNGSVLTNAKIIEKLKKGVYISLPRGERGFVSKSELDHFDLGGDDCGGDIPVRVTDVDYLSHTGICTIIDVNSLQYEDVQVGSLYDVTIENKYSEGYVLKLGSLTGYLPLTHVNDDPGVIKKSLLKKTLRKLKYESSQRVKAVKVENDHIWFTMKPTLLAHPLLTKDCCKPGDFHYGWVIAKKVKEKYPVKMIKIRFSQFVIGFMKIEDNPGSEEFQIDDVVGCYFVEEVEGKRVWSLSPQCHDELATTNSPNITGVEHNEIGGLNVGDIVEGIVTHSNANEVHLTAKGNHCVLPSSHLKNEANITQDEMDTIAPKDRTLTVKVLNKKDTYYFVTMKPTLLQNHTPKSVLELKLDNYYYGYVSKLELNKCCINFGPCWGYLKENVNLRIGQVVGCYVNKLSNEKPPLLSLYNFKPGSQYNLKVLKIYQTGITAEVQLLPTEHDNKCFIPVWQLSDVFMLCKQILRSFKTGDIIQGAVFLYTTNVPIFSIKKSLIRFIKEYNDKFLSPSNASVKEVYIPCTISNTKSNRKRVAVPLDASVRCSNMQKNFHSSRVHQTFFAKVAQYNENKQTLFLNFNFKPSVELKNKWIKEYLSEYVDFVHSGFQFGTKVIFTLTTPNSGRGIQNINDEKTFALNYKKINLTLHEPTEGILVHREVYPSIYNYVLTTEPNIKMDQTEEDYNGKGFGEVMATVIYTNSIMQLAIIQEPLDCAGLSVYISQKSVNGVNMSKIREFIPTCVELIGEGKKYFIGLPIKSEESDKVIKPKKEIKKEIKEEEILDEIEMKGETLDETEMKYEILDEPEIKEEILDENEINYLSDDYCEEMSEGEEKSVIGINSVSSDQDKESDRESHNSDRKGTRRNRDVLPDSSSIPEQCNSGSSSSQASKKRKLSIISTNTPAIDITKKKLETISNLSMEETDSFVWDATPQDLAQVTSKRFTDLDIVCDEISAPIAKKKLNEVEKEKRIREKEHELLTAMENPKSADHFERLILAKPNDSKIWIQYMAYHLEATEVEKARSVAERAFKLINHREEQELLNVWIALLNMEHLYGTKEQFKETMAEALKKCDDLKINLKVLDMYAESKSTFDLEQLVNKMVKKYKQDFECWYSCLACLMTAEMVDKARQLLQTALKNLKQKDVIIITSRFALLENKAGHAEEAQALFDNILTAYPGRTDIWFVYIDMLVKSESYDLARQVFERAVSQKLPAKKMKSIYTKWIKFETEHGDQRKVLKVRESASQYVNEVLSSV